MTVPPPAVDVAAERVLAIIAGNGGQHGFTDKLASVEVGSPDSVYMALAFCFDLFRRSQYMYKLSRQFADLIPGDLAREILSDHAEMNADNMTWKQRAEVAQSVMLRLHAELAEEWETNLNNAASHSSN